MNGQERHLRNQQRNAGGDLSEELHPEFEERLGVSTRRDRGRSVRAAVRKVQIDAGASRDQAAFTESGDADEVCLFNLQRQKSVIVIRSRHRARAGSDHIFTFI